MQRRSTIHPITFHNSSQSSTPPSLKLCFPTTSLKDCKPAGHPPIADALTSHRHERKYTNSGGVHVRNVDSQYFTPAEHAVETVAVAMVVYIAALALEHSVSTLHRRRKSVRTCNKLRFRNQHLSGRTRAMRDRQKSALAVPSTLS